MIKVILISIVLFLLFSSLWGFYISIKPPKIISNLTPKNLGLEYEKITLTTADGIKLSGWLIPRQEASIELGRMSSRRAPDKTKDVKTIILLHGYPADKGNILPPLSFLAEKYNLFLFDFRYLGQSGGKYSTAGAKETEDLLTAIRFLKSRNIHEVGVWGFSMGGAVALMASSKAPEIKVVISESSYARIDLMALELYRIPILRYPLAYLTGLWAKVFLGVNFKNVSPEKNVEGLTIPILLIHSKNDEVIPFKNALILQKALRNNPRAEFWFEEKLIHGQLDKEYQKRIEDFFEKNL